MVAVTSQVTHSETWGAVKADCTMAVAVALRTPLIGIRVSDAPVVAGAAGAASAGSESLDAALGHVVAGDHATDATAAQRTKINSEILGQLAHRRLGQDRSG